MTTPDISVVIPSYLGDYPGAATDRPAKLHRAVCSVIASTGEARIEIVLVSDGCDKTDAYFAQLASAYGGSAPEVKISEKLSAKLVRIEKAPFYDGVPRNAGNDAATAPIVGYVDYDDYVLPHHFDNVVKNFGNHQWCYWDDIVWPNQHRPTKLQHGDISTACIAHRRELVAEGGVARWGGGYASDWDLIEKLMKLAPDHAFIANGGHVRCHIPGKLDV